jgi:hypothetical protein
MVVKLYQLQHLYKCCHHQGYGRFYPDPTWYGGGERSFGQYVTILPTQHNSKKYQLWPAYKIWSFLGLINITYIFIYILLALILSKFPKTMLQHDCLIMEQLAPSLAWMRPYQTFSVQCSSIVTRSTRVVMCHWLIGLSISQKRCNVLQDQLNLDWFLHCRLILSFAKNSVQS